MEFDAKDHEAFITDLSEDGFHIYSRKSANIPGFYPPPRLDYPEIDLSNLKEDDRITVRAFFCVGKVPTDKIDSGHMLLEVEHVDHEGKTLYGNILTELPPDFALAKNTTIELAFDEVLSVEDD